MSLLISNALRNKLFVLTCLSILCLDAVSVWKLSKKRKKEGTFTSGSRGAAILSAALGHAPFLPAKGARANPLPHPLQLLLPTRVDSGFGFHTCDLSYVNLSRRDWCLTSSCSVRIGKLPDNVASVLQLRTRLYSEADVVVTS